MKNVFLGSAIGALLAAPSLADNTVLEEVTVTGLRERLYQAGMLKDVIQKTEVISNISIEKMNAASLTEAIAEAPGVRVNNECSMCGVKRVMLNGLRGEHRTILVDGIPTFTMMSGL
jgi:outer membrane cobalamin receptor